MLRFWLTGIWQAQMAMMAGNRGPDQAKGRGKADEKERERERAVKY